MNVLRAKDKKMRRLQKMIDPPSGWKYGFPKPIPQEHEHRTMEWLIEQGYPQSEIDKCGKHFFCRYWEAEQPIPTHNCHMQRNYGIKKGMMQE